MKNKITVRLAKPEEAETVIDWTIQNPGNHFDLDVFGYPSTMVLAAENGSPKFFMPMQAAFVLESLAPDPKIGLRDRVLSLEALFQAARNLAKGMKVGEIYFLCSDERVNKHAEIRGFERINLPVYRMKVDNDQPT